MPQEAWTKRLFVPWDMSVAYYQRRWDALKRIEDANLLHEHRVVDERIAMRLADTYHLVSFGDGYFDAALLTPDADVSRLRQALDILFETLEPRDLLQPIFDSQWLTDLGIPYDEARTSAALAAFGEVGSDVVDWSLTIDGRIEEPSTTYKAEFGIVSASEAPLRLARGASTFVAPPDPDVPPTIWPPTALPEVAWFFDSRCELRERVQEPSIDALFGLWSRVQESISKVQSSFKASFNIEGGSHEHRGT